MYRCILYMVFAQVTDSLQKYQSIWLEFDTCTKKKWTPPRKKTNVSWSEARGENVGETGLGCTCDEEFAFCQSLQAAITTVQ